MDRFSRSDGNFSPITEATNAVNNLGIIYGKIIEKLRQASQNKVNNPPKKLEKNNHVENPAVSTQTKNRLQENVRHQKKANKRYINTQPKRKRSSIKLKATQPYQLRKLPQTNGEKKIYGFGSFVTLPEKTQPQKQRPLKRPDWRTRAMLSRMMKLNAETAAQSIKSKSSTMISRKSSFVQKRLQDKPPDETAALSYVQSKPKLFIPCRSASRSFNLSLNLQELHVRESNMKKMARDVQVEKAVECPAMHRSCSDFPINRDEMWGVPCVPARCTCFPGKYEKTPVLPPSRSNLAQSHQGLFVETFVKDLKKDWKSMSHNVGSVLSTQYLTKEEQMNHIKSLIPHLKTRELQLGEVEGVVKEMKKMKERLISLEMNNPTHRKTDGLKLVLKKIHSAL